MAKKLPQSSSLTVNRKALADYEVLEKIEAGIVLTGGEVKSARAGQVNLKSTFVEITPKLEAFVKNMHISPYKPAHQVDYLPTQRRKLLLNKTQIEYLQEQIDTKGITAVPLDMHISHNVIKITIAVCKGKKKYDRREDLKKRSQSLEINRALKKFGK
jgi:SsrA-binding protein